MDKFGGMRALSAVAKPLIYIDKAGPVKETINYGIDNRRIANGLSPFLEADI